MRYFLLDVCVDRILMVVMFSFDCIVLVSMDSIYFFGLSCKVFYFGVFFFGMSLCVMDGWLGMKFVYRYWLKFMVVWWYDVI